MSCANTYCSWLGQDVNIDKSGCFYLKGFQALFMKQVKCSYGFKKLPSNTKYLGSDLVYQKILVETTKEDGRYLTFGRILRSLEEAI